MRIAVIADTHIPHKHEEISERVFKGLAGVDLILHCGDIVEPWVLEELETIAPVKAVAGNHDLKRFGNSLPRRQVVEVNGYRIGMIHGDCIEGLHVNKTQLFGMIYQTIVKPFLEEEEGLDIIVFGHGHKPFIDCHKAVFTSKDNPKYRLKKDLLVFNPGMPVRNRHIASIGYINLDRDSFTTEVKVFTYPRDVVET